jgi:hypothetical protein
MPRASTVILTRILDHATEETSASASLCRRRSRSSLLGVVMPRCSRRAAFSGQLWQKCRCIRLRSGRNMIAANRPAGCTGVQEAEPEFRKGRRSETTAEWSANRQTVRHLEPLVVTYVFRGDLGERLRSQVDHAQRGAKDGCVNGVKRPKTHSWSWSWRPRSRTIGRRERGIQCQNSNVCSCGGRPNYPSAAAART